MNNKKLILEIYNKTINDILIGIDGKYKEELCLAYIEYLKKKYLNFDLDLGNKKPEELISLFVDLEKSKWKDTNVDAKLSELLSDSAFENIKHISNTGYKYAKSMLDKKFESGVEMLLQPVITEEKAQQSIEMLNTYYEQVRDFNKKIATYYVSEGSIDFQYASGITENMSLRIGRIKR